MENGHAPSAHYEERMSDSNLIPERNQWSKVCNVHRESHGGDAPFDRSVLIGYK